MNKMPIYKSSTEKAQGSKLEFLSSLIEYALKNNFADTIEYLGNNSGHLVPNLTLFVSLNVETKEYFAFAHKKIKKSYLSFVLESIREFSSNTLVDVSLSQYTRKILSNMEQIDADGPSRPEFIFTIPVFSNGRPIVFLNFSKNGHLSHGGDEILNLNLVANLLSSLCEREAREKTEKESTEKLSLIDPLTGVFNRRAFYQIFSQDISEGRRRGISISLILFDIDGFKQINDSHGHAYGDLILKEVITKFRNLLREDDKIFRLGGDEFAVILKVDKKEALSVIQRIIKEVSDSRSPRIITLSGGIVEIDPCKNISADEAVMQADKALYLAKESGKNQVLFYEGEELKTKSDELLSNNVTSELIEDINFRLKEFAAQQITSLYFSQEDKYIYNHSIIVSNYAVQLGKELKLPKNRLQNLRLGAILYDIGMIAVPASILFKSTKLTREEYEIIRHHPITGGRIIQRFPILRDVLSTVLYHHEWINGQGYPFGLAGDSIPLEARIVAVADAYHAMDSDRPYRSTLPKEKSISEIIKGRGTKYDPQVVEALLKLIEKRMVA